MDFGMWIGSTSCGAQFWSLKRNFDESFDLAIEMMTKPRFDAERLETLRGQYIQRMQRRSESPGRAVATLLNHVLYHDHPRLGYTPPREAIEAVTPAQIRELWGEYFGRQNMFITVVGDFESAKMLKLLQSKLGGWRTAGNPTRKEITHEPIIRPGAYVVEQELPQPAIRLAHQIPIDRRAPMKDHAALEILNDILGGSGFRSRLMERLRSDEGLTYGVYSNLSHQGRPDVPGRLQVAYQTKKESVLHSINSVLEEVHKIIAEEVGPAEVQEQIEAWRNRFIFQYTNDFFNAYRLMLNELDDRDYDFDNQELSAVQKVTVKDVQRVAKKYISPKNLTIAIYGALTDEDRVELSEKFKLKTLTREEIFTGGYEVAEPEPAEAAGAR